MKKSFLLHCAALVAVLSGAVSCGGEENPPQKEMQPLKDIVLTQAESEVQACENTFALGLFREICAVEKDQNLMISPFSASLCLSLAASGADGETFTQMASTLGFAGFSAGQIGSYYKSMCAGLFAVDTTTRLSIANAIWPAVNFPLKKTYADFVRNYYSAEVENLDFATQNAVNTVNGWVFTNTNGMIPKLMDGPDPAIRLMLANALYFNGKWSGGKMDSQQKDFTSFAGTKAKTKFLGSTRAMKWGSGKGFTVCSVPYGNGAYRMVIFLPDAGKDLSSLVASLTPELWDQTLSNLRECEVTFSMPVFKSEYSIDNILKNTLISMGMPKAFSGYADFSKISDESVYIDEIVQKTAIDVSETGTEAAAVTAIYMKATAVADPEPPKVFTADRPFAYAIVEHTFNTILFIGIHGK